MFPFLTRLVSAYNLCFISFLCQHQQTYSLTGCLSYRSHWCSNFITTSLLHLPVSCSTCALTSLLHLHIPCSTTALTGTSTCLLPIQPLPQLPVDSAHSPHPLCPSIGLTPSISFFIQPSDITLTPCIPRLHNNLRSLSQFRHPTSSSALTLMWWLGPSCSSRDLMSLWFLPNLYRCSTAMWKWHIIHFCSTSDLRFVSIVYIPFSTCTLTPHSHLSLPGVPGAMMLITRLCITYSVFALTSVAYLCLPTSYGSMMSLSILLNHCTWYALMWWSSIRLPLTWGAMKSLSLLSIGCWYCDLISLAGCCLPHLTTGLSLLS